MFRITVPLDDTYSYDYNLTGQIGQYEKADQSNQSDQSNLTGQTNLTDDEFQLLCAIKAEPELSTKLLGEKLGWTTSRVKYYIQKLKSAGAIQRVGTSRSGKWKLRQ